MSPFARLAAAFILTTSPLFVGVGPLLAIDYYVDGTNGDDANSGLSRDEAFKTITYSLEMIQPTEDTPATVSVAAGAYSASTNGETFPLELKSHVRLLGEGPESSVLDAEYNANHIVICQSVENVRIIGLGLLHSYALGEEQAEDGGCAIICDRSSLELQGCVVAENSAMYSDDAGAILCRNSWLTLDSCTIRDNRTGVRFGPGGTVSAPGVSCEYSLLTVRSCLIADNISTSPVGDNIGRGDVLSILRSKLTLERSHIRDNRGYRTIFVSFSNADINACEIRGNAGGGEGLSVFESFLVMRNCALENNSCRGTLWYGGGGDATEAWISDCVIRGNSGGECCVSCCLSTMHLTRCIIAENNVSMGAVAYTTGEVSSTRSSISAVEDRPPYVPYTTDEGISTRTDAANPCRLYIEDCLICENACGARGPIARANWSAWVGPYDDMLSVKRCTIVDNRQSVPPQYQYIIVNGWNVHLEDNVIADNDGTLFWRPPTGTGDDPRHFQVRNCCLQEEFQGEGNFVADPMFVSGPLGDYYLSSVEAGQEADSPCIDAGSTSASIAGVNNFTTRTDGAFDTGVADIGYHYSATPPTIDCFVSAGSEPMHPGDALSASISIENGGLPLWVDVYAGFILPDGGIFCITPDGLTTELVPWAATSHLPRDFASGDITVFEAQMPEGLPEGTYTLAAALSLTAGFRPIGDIAFASFAVGSVGRAF